MATNLYNTSCTPNLGGVSDHYTKAEVNQLFAAKAGTATTYTRTYLDGELGSITSSIASLTASQVTDSELALALGLLQTEIESDVEDTYATLADTYTKTEVDALVAGINLDPDTLLLRVPTTTVQNTINPGTNNAVALTVRGSSINPIVSEWRDSTGDRIGYVSNSGGVVFENKLTVGRLVSDGSAALDVSGKRISNVADPILSRDAVPLAFMQSEILNILEDIVRPNTLTFYNLNAGEY